MKMLLQNAKQGIPHCPGDQPPPAAPAAGFKLCGSDFPSSSRPADEKGPGMCGTVPLAPA
jgi:hypothetical protein